MNRIELVRIVGGVETVLEICEVSEGLVPSMVFYPLGHIESLEKHYKKTGKPKMRRIDVLYLTRLQKEEQ